MDVVSSVPSGIVESLSVSGGIGGDELSAAGVAGACGLSCANGTVL